MSIIKIRKKDAPFVVIARECLQDARLSWRARGLLSYLLSLPHDWEIRITDLIQRSPEGRDAVYSIIKELRRFGYVHYTRQRHEDGTLGAAEYHVLDQPEPEAITEPELIPPLPNQDMPNEVNPTLDKPDPYIINNIQNKQLTKETAATDTQITKDRFGDNAAAVFSKKDALIGKSLTAYQNFRVENLAKYLLKHVQPVSLVDFITQINETLLSNNSFSQAGRDFHKKLNTIQKVITKGKWTPPIESIQHEQQKQEEQFQLLQKEVETAFYQMKHWERMLDYANSSKQKDTTHIENLISEHRNKFETLKKQLKQQEEESVMA